MIFLIEFNPDEGRTVSVRAFEVSERSSAHKARLDLELDLNRRRSSHEVVLLEAEDEKALRSTHGRYFDASEEYMSLAEILKSISPVNGRSH